MKFIQRTLVTLTVATLALPLACAAQTPVTTSPANTLKVKIIGFNDFHGNLKSPGNFSGMPAGGADFFAAYANQLKAQNPNNVVVSAGDLIGASPLISALFHDEPTIEAMNRIGLDINAVGNHEFDEGKTELLRMQNGGCHPTDPNTCQGAAVGTPVPFEGADFSFLAANVIDTATGKSIFPRYTIKTFEGVKIAFIGMTLEGTPTIVTPTGVAGLEFKDEADTVNGLINQLRNLGTQAVVVVIHEGGFQSGSFNGCVGPSGPIIDIVARLHSTVDLVVSGHTHQAYICQLPNSAGKLIPVTSASAFGRLLTDIDLTLDRKTRDVIASTATNIIVNRANTAVTPAASLTTLVANYDTLAAPIANRVIGSITADITRTLSPAGESTAGNLIADSQLAATAAPTFGNAVIAFMNPGGIRADFLFAASGSEGNGNVTYGEAFTVQPFGNSLVTLTLTGAQVEMVLEEQFVGCPNGQTANRILQPSVGFQYTWNASGPACDKIDPASISLNGIAIVPAASYRVTVNSFLADGGDRFTTLIAGTARLGGAIDLDALADFLGSQSPVSPTPLNRVLRLN